MSDFTETPELPPPGPLPIPWERPGAGLGDLFSTIKLFITNPDGGFSRLPASNSVGRALIFGMLLNVVANAIGGLWNLVFGANPQALFEKLGLPVLPSTTIYAIGVVVSPILYLVGAFIVSGILHLVLLMLGGGPGGFKTTLRVYCYSAVATLSLVIPFVGGLVSLVWMVVLLIVGLKAAHRIPTGRSVGAVLIPFGACCVCTVVLGVVFFAALASAFGAGAH